MKRSRESKNQSRNATIDNSYKKVKTKKDRTMIDSNNVGRSNDDDDEGWIRGKRMRESESVCENPNELSNNLASTIVILLITMCAYQSLNHNHNHLRRVAASCSHGPML